MKTQLSFALITCLLAVTALAGCSENNDKLDDYPFQSPPTGVPIFTIELRPTTGGCEITPGGIYSPGGDAEWHVNTGNVTIGFQWSPTVWGESNDGGQKQINTGGEWQSLALSDPSKPFRFCMVLLGDGHEVLTEGLTQTIALALVDTTLLKG